MRSGSRTGASTGSVVTLCQIARLGSRDRADRRRISWPLQAWEPILAKGVGRTRRARSKNARGKDVMPCLSFVSPVASYYIEPRSPLNFSSHNSIYCCFRAFFPSFPGNRQSCAVSTGSSFRGAQSVIGNLQTRLSLRKYFMPQDDALHLEAQTLCCCYAWRVEHVCTPLNAP